MQRAKKSDIKNAQLRQYKYWVLKIPTKQIENKIKIKFRMFFPNLHKQLHIK